MIYCCARFFDHNALLGNLKIDLFDSAGTAKPEEDQANMYGFFFQNAGPKGLQVVYSLGNKFGAAQDALFTVFLEGQTELLDITDLEIV